jgi:hypothetical protein
VEEQCFNHKVKSGVLSGRIVREDLHRELPVSSIRQRFIGSDVQL